MIRKNNNMYPPTVGLWNYRKGYEDGLNRGKDELADVLDKISADIDKAREDLDGYNPNSLGVFVSRVDEIIEKYKEVK